MEEEKEVLLFRIAQEALANVRKHSRGKTVEVSLVSGNGDLRLSVRDDGDGFDAENILAGSNDGMRFGILGCVVERRFLVAPWILLRSRVPAPR